MNDEKLNELVVNIAALVRGVEELRHEVHGNSLRVDTLQQEVGTLRQEMHAGFQRVERETAVMAARLDEQRQTINAMIPVRLAAVPAAPPAA